jgi:glycosyltransferase involved in cell wall biosynthesis
MIPSIQFSPMNLAYRRTELTDAPLVSVVMPCLNEEEAIGSCIEKIQRTFAAAGIDGEIIVCDNGSTDSSVAIAEAMGVRVVRQPLRGYGNAYLKGFEIASGRYLIMGDADDTYDFGLIPKFLELLGRGYDFVTGSRYLKGGHQEITPLHRFVGNPILTAMLNGFFGMSYTDVYCGFRGFSREAYDRIRPVSPGMEFNLELAINAGMAGLRTAEVPIKLNQRKGSSKLRTFRDGWRSLRMMLLYCPNKVFLWPGSVLFVLGFLLHVGELFGLVTWDGRPAAGVTGVFATIFTVLGFQVLTLGLHAKTYSWSRRFDKENAALEWLYDHFKLEAGLVLGGGLFTLGAIILAALVLQWLNQQMRPLPKPELASLGTTLVLVGCSTVFSSLFISAMSISKESGRG